MIIKVRSSSYPSEREFEIRSTKLGDLFEELSGDDKPAGFDFFDSKNGGVMPDCEVVVNGLQYEARVHSLDSLVKDGDKIEIFILLVPGG
jgi:hypothetical protein